MEYLGTSEQSYYRLTWRVVIYDTDGSVLKDEGEWKILPGSERYIKLERAQQVMEKKQAKFDRLSKRMRRSGSYPEYHFRIEQKVLHKYEDYRPLPAEARDGEESVRKMSSYRITLGGTVLKEGFRKIESAVGFLATEGVVVEQKVIVSILEFKPITTS